MEQQPKSRGIRWWLIVAVLMVVLLCLIVFVYNLQVG